MVRICGHATGVVGDWRHYWVRHSLGTCCKRLLEIIALVVTLKINTSITNCWGPMAAQQLPKGHRLGTRAREDTGSFINYSLVDSLSWTTLVTAMLGVGDIFFWDPRSGDKTFSHSTKNLEIHVD